MNRPVPSAVDARNNLARDAWNANAAFWDERMGEGNDFHRLLLAPALEKLLEVQPGQHILEAACGNGQLARRLVELGASVVAFDFAPRMIEIARVRSAGQDGGITFLVLDATDASQLRTLGPEPFDAMVCNMGFMDMAVIEPLLEAGTELLKAGGRFVFSVQHPCFNSAYATLIAEIGDGADGRGRAEFALRLAGYKEQRVSYGEAVAGQPVSHLYFHRPLEELFGSFFGAGYVLDGLLEPVFSGQVRPGRGPSWYKLPGIPPVLVARMRYGLAN